MHAALPAIQTPRHNKRHMICAWGCWGLWNAALPAAPSASVPPTPTKSGWHKVIPSWGHTPVTSGARMVALPSMLSRKETLASCWSSAMASLFQHRPVYGLGLAAAAAVPHSGSTAALVHSKPAACGAHAMNLQGPPHHKSRALPCLWLPQWIDAAAAAKRVQLYMRRGHPVGAWLW
jgi:hypothetical protein